MKNSLSKILGVFLTLAVLAGLLMSAVPVAAADSDEGFGALPSPVPPEGGKTTFITENTSLGFFVQAADGLTQFAWGFTKADKTAGKLYKSTDGGQTWAATPGTNTLNGLTTEVTALAVSDNYANDSTVVAATGTSVYRSTNGGTGFGILPGMTGFAGTKINSLDYGLDINGTDTDMLIGADNGVYFWTSKTYTVTAPGTADTPTFGLTGNATSVAFSPNFNSDFIMFAITYNGSTVIQNKELTGAASTPIVTSAGLGATGSSLFVPADYDPASNNVVLVALNPGGLVKADFTGGTATTLFSTSAGATSVAVDSAGKGYIGLTNGDVRYATGVLTSSSPTWSNATKKPIGENALVKINNAGNIVVAEGGTSGAIYISTDAGVTYNATALISFNKTNFAYQSLNVIDVNTWYLMTKDGDHFMLMKTTNAGKAWQVIFNYTSATIPLLGVFPSPLYSTDKTLYVPQANNKVWKSTNEGSTFAISTVPGPGTTNPVMTAFAAKDGSTFYVAYSDKVFKSGRNTAATGVSNNVTQLVVAPNGDIIAGTDNGNVLKSVDDGGSFANVATTAGSTTAGTTEANVALAPDYVSSNILYAASAGGVYILDVAGSKWANMNAAAAQDQVAAASNNVVYYNLAAGGFARSLNPGTSKSVWDTANKAPGNAVLEGINLIGNQLYAISGATTLVTYNDVDVAPVTTTTPKNNDANVPANNVQFTWNAFSAIPYSIKYDLQVARDNKFVSAVVDTTSTNTTINFGGPVSGTLFVYSASPSAFIPGTTYYWRVRVAPGTAGDPLRGNWSATQAFTVALNSDVNPGVNASGRISPENGATNVSTTPVITWGSVTGATAYNIKIATDPAFTNIVDSKDGLTSTVYTPAAALKPNTNYFWEVQPVNGTVPGQFVVSAFTTAGAAAPTSTAAPPPATVTIPPITVPTPQITVSVPTPTVTTTPGTTGTPAWAWVVIVIGAVLVIAVIVLIVRTRRV